MKIKKELMELPVGGKIVHGGAIGADRIAGGIAAYLGYDVQVFKAEWELHGKRASAIRNNLMLNTAKPDLVLAFWDGKSRGTKNMIDIAKKAGVKVKVVTN